MFGGQLTAELYRAASTVKLKLNFQSKDSALAFVTAKFGSILSYSDDYDERRTVSDARRDEQGAILNDFSETHYGGEIFRQELISDEEMAYFYCDFWKSTMEFYEKTDAEVAKGFAEDYNIICTI
jgi:hypothetical protein